MNAPLPESVRKALARHTLDDETRCGAQRSREHGGTGAAGRGGFGAGRAAAKET